MKGEVKRFLIASLLGALGLAPSASAQLASVRTVFVIVMENTDWSDIKGNSQAPYINKTLLPMASHAEQYYSSGMHPSLANYLWLEAGDNFGILDDKEPRSNHQSTRLHLVRLLRDAGISWKAYAEDIPGNQCPLTATAQYVPEHVPMIYFEDVTDTNSANSAYCIAHVRPYTELAADLAASTVARYNFIIPNLCNDMHDCDVRTGDT